MDNLIRIAGKQPLSQFNQAFECMEHTWRELTYSIMLEMVANPGHWTVYTVQYQKATKSDYVRFLARSLSTEGQ